MGRCVYVWVYVCNKWTVMMAMALTTVMAEMVVMMSMMVVAVMIVMTVVFLAFLAAATVGKLWACAYVSG